MSEGGGEGGRGTNNSIACNPAENYHLNFNPLATVTQRVSRDWWDESSWLTTLKPSPLRERHFVLFQFCFSRNLVYHYPSDTSRRARTRRLGREEISTELNLSMCNVGQYQARDRFLEILRQLWSTQVAGSEFVTNGTRQNLSILHFSSVFNVRRVKDTFW